MKTSTLGASIALALFSTGVESCAYGTSLHRRAEVVAAPKFGYTGTQGPLNWAGLDTAKNGICKTGKNQSPIDVQTRNTTIDAGSAYKVAIPNTRGSEFVNLGTTVEVVVNGTLQSPTKKYNLAQFHFHTPSEHRVDGLSFAMESHFVFQAEDKSLAVVGFLIDVGPSNDPLFGTVLPSVANITTLGSKVETRPLSFNKLTEHLSNNTVFRYVGSLTTPPCSEGVDWIISSKPLTVTYQNFMALKSVVKFNSRYTQNTPGQNNLLSL